MYVFLRRKYSGWTALDFLSNVLQATYFTFKKEKRKAGKAKDIVYYSVSDNRKKFPTFS